MNPAKRPFKSHETRSLERFNDATLFVSTSLKALEWGDLPLQHSPSRYISQYLVDFVGGRGLQDEDKSTVCNRESTSENFLVSFKLASKVGRTPFSKTSTVS